MNEYAASNLWITGLAYSDSDNSVIENIAENITGLAAISYNSDSTPNYNTDGIIQKPSDIVMNILTNEMDFGKYDEQSNIGQDLLAPNVKAYNREGIDISREIHANWKMGFSIDKEENGKKLIENILKESKSYPKFTNTGEFGLISIKESYNWYDIDKIIDINDILKYKFSETKRENIITSATMFYRYDYGQKKYTMDVQDNIASYLPDYLATGLDNYSIDASDGHKNINLKYHSDTNTVKDFMKYNLLNNCNTHNVVEMTLPLSYMGLTIGDKIHFPLIDNKKLFNLDYSVIDFKNSQPIYPLWIILEVNMGIDNIRIKAYQLHYLDFGGQHGWGEGGILGNTVEFSPYTFTTGEPVPYWNYNPDATVDSGIRIPYFSINLDENIDMADFDMVDSITESREYTETEAEIMKYMYDGSLKPAYHNNIFDKWNVLSIIEHNQNN